MQNIKLKKRLIFIPIALIVLLTTLIDFTPVVAATCMCDCAMFPGSCGATLSTLVESCNLSASTQASCEAGGCTGKKSAFNCSWAF